MRQMKHMPGGQNEFRKEEFSDLHVTILDSVYLLAFLLSAFDVSPIEQIQISTTCVY